MNHITMIALILLFAACSATVDDHNMAGSDFQVTTIEATAGQLNPYSTLWNDISRSKTLSMRACIQDAALLEPIPGIKFKISDGNRSYESSTDGNGCLYWSEEISFDYLSQEKYFNGQRIFSTGTHYSSKVVVPVAFNPWESGELLLKDLRKTKPHNQTTNKNLVTKNLDLNSLSLSFDEQSQSVSEMTSKVYLQLAPQLKRTGINGDLIEEQLTSGLFNVQLEILERANDSQAVATLSQSSTEATITNSKLSTELELTINDIPLTSSQLQVALRLTPIGAPANLQPLEALFNLDSLRGNKTLSPIKLEDSLASYKSTPLIKNNSSKEFGFVVDEIAIEKGAYFHPTYTDSPERRLQVKYTACLKNAFDKSSISEHQFFSSLTPIDQDFQIQLRPVDLRLSGCFTSTAVIEFHQYDIEHWISFDIVVSSKSNPYKNITKKRRIYINPWGNGDTFFFDSRHGNPPQNPEGRRPEIYVEEVGYKFRGNTNNGYELDKYMQLQLTKEFEIYFEPKVKQFHSFAGDVVYSPINSGNFELEVYLLAITNGKIDYEDLRIEDYSLMAKTIVNDDAENGQISAHVKLQMSFIDLPQLLARNLLVIKVSPTNKDSRLFPTIVSVPFDFKDHNFNVLSKGFDEQESLPWTKKQNIENINQISLKLDALKRRDDLTVMPMVSPLNLFRQRVNASNKINRNNPQLSLNISNQGRIKAQYKLDLPNDWVDKIIGDGSLDNAGELCALLYERKKSSFFDIFLNPSNITDFERCKKSPESAINILPTTHVNRIIGKPFKEHASPGIMIRSHVNGISMNFSREKSKGRRFTTGLNGSLGIDILGGKVFSGLKAGGHVSYDWYWAESDNESLSNNTTITESRSSYLFYNHLILSFEADVTQCALISAKKMEYIYTYPTLSFGGSYSVPMMESRILDSPETFHVCQSRSRIEDLKEHWYFIGEYWKGQSVLADGMETKENPLTQLIRGEKNFELYRKEVDLQNKEMILMEVSNDLVNEHYQELYEYGETPVPLGLFKDNAFPGFIYK